MAIKLCSSCKEQKELSEFHTNKVGKLGVSSRCKTCACKISKEWRLKNPLRAKEAKKSWCEKNRDYVLDKKKQWHHKNKAVANAKSKEWRKKNPELAKAAIKKWIEANKNSETYIQSRRISNLARRDRMKVAKTERITIAMIDNLCDLQCNKCAVCRTLFINKNWHIDHIYPVSKGGLTEKNNLQLLCPQCNLSKNAKDPIQFMQEKGYLL